MLPDYLQFSVIVNVQSTFESRYALVICNHPPPLTRHGGRAGDIHGDERGFDQMSRQCGEIPGVCFIYAKRAVNENIADCW